MEKKSSITTPEALKKTRPFIINLLGLSATGKSETASYLSKNYSKLGLPSVGHMNCGEIYRLLAYTIHQNLAEEITYPFNQKLLLRDQLPDPITIIKALIRLEEEIIKGRYYFKNGDEGMHCFIKKDSNVNNDVDIHYLLHSTAIDLIGPPHNNTSLVQNWAKRMINKMIENQNQSIIVVDGRRPICNSDLTIILHGSLEKRAERKIANRANKDTHDMIKQLSSRDNQDKSAINLSPTAWWINTDQISNDEVAQLISFAFNIKKGLTNLTKLDKSYQISTEFISPIGELLYNDSFRLALINDLPIKQEGIIVNGERLIKTVLTI